MVEETIKPEQSEQDLRKEKRKRRKARKERRMARAAKLAVESPVELPTPEANLEFLHDQVKIGMEKAAELFTRLGKQAPAQESVTPVKTRHFLFWKIENGKWSKAVYHQPAGKTPPVTKQPPTSTSKGGSKNSVFRYFLFWKRKTEPEEPNAYVSDFKNGLDFETVNPDLIPAESRVRSYKGYQVHVLSRDREGVVRVAEPPRIIGENESPSEVYTALNCPEVEIILGIPDTLWNKISHIALYVLIGVDLIFVFLIWGSSI